jgi:site-specific DNA-methyltransferase (adenine-specific)
MSRLPGLSAVQWDIREGDCLEQLRTLENGSVDIVVTSPPYNLAIAYSTYQDDMPREEYLDWCHAWATEVARVLKEDGSFF